MGRGILMVLGCLAWSMVDGDQQVGQELGMGQREVSFDELTIEAAKLGMEIIPPEEWMTSRRRLQAADSNCWDVVVTEPYGICNGEYYGEGDRDSYASALGPTLFLATCFEPDDCGDNLLALNRRMFMARAFRCPDGETVDCPKEEVWGVYSAITEKTNTTTGENKLGFLRAWAEDALHPVDVVTQWWTFQYTSLHEEDADEPRECLNPDCLIPLENVTIACAPGSDNWTRPPSITPYPTMVPIPYDTPAPIPTNAPVTPDQEIGTFEDRADLNGAKTRATPLAEAGLVWQGIGLIAMAAGWWAVVGRQGIADAGVTGL